MRKASIGYQVKIKHDERIKINNIARRLMIDLYQSGETYRSITYKVRRLGYSVNHGSVAKFLKSKGLMPRRMN